MHTVSTISLAYKNIVNLHNIGMMAEVSEDTKRATSFSPLKKQAGLAMCTMIICCLGVKSDDYDGFVTEDLMLM